ncbi:hypothetical protein BDV3_000297 [Batrachochytrium dendrobatidis]
MVSDPGTSSIGFVIACTGLVFIMIPGVGLFYSGLARSKNALSLIMLSMLSMSVVTIQWVLFGFSLAFSDTGSAIIGNFAMGGLNSVGMDPIPVVATFIPGILFAVYQMQFATITVALVYGSVVERIRLVPALVFAFVWTTVVYDPIAYWSWANRGWVRNMGCLSTTALNQTPCGIGSLDFAGGGPVHVASGFAGLAYCLVVGKRRSIGPGSEKVEFLPHNITNVFIGAALLWFGWFGFNGGSALAATPRAAMAVTVTTISAATGSLAWTIMACLNHNRLSGIGFCSGAIAGLVAITPSAGYVAPWAALIIGFLSGVSCYYATRIKDAFGFDDSLDAWGVHGVGGILGSLLTGVFAQKKIAALDGASIDGGWIDGNWIQMGYQISGTVSIAVWSFVGSLLILLVIDVIPGLSLRPTPEDEDAGADYSEMGETCHSNESTRIINGTNPSLSDVSANRSSTHTLRVGTEVF